MNASLEKAKKLYDKYSLNPEGENAMIISTGVFAFAGMSIFCVICFIIMPIKKHLQAYLKRVREEEDMD